MINIPQIREYPMKSKEVIKIYCEKIFQNINKFQNRYNNYYTNFRGFEATFFIFNTRSKDGEQTIVL